MTGPHGCQSKRMIRFRVFLITNADSGVLQQAHDRGQHLRFGQTPALKVMCHPASNPWKSLAERDHAMILGFIANAAVFRVIKILLATTRIAPYGLQVTLRRRADPNLSPGRRYDQRTNPGQYAGVAD